MWNSQQETEPSLPREICEVPINDLFSCTMPINTLLLVFEVKLKILLVVFFYCLFKNLKKKN